MFYAIDLSKPRKYILEKYDDIVFEYKLNPPKINKKTLVIVLAVGLVLVIGTSVNAADIMNTEQYKNLLNYYVNDLHYPKNIAEKLLNNLTMTDFQELYSRVLQEKQNAKDLAPFLGIGEKVKDILVKALFY